MKKLVILGLLSMLSFYGCESAVEKEYHKEMKDLEKLEKIGRITSGDWKRLQGYRANPKAQRELDIQETKEDIAYCEKSLKEAKENIKKYEQPNQKWEFDQMKETIERSEGCIKERTERLKQLGG